MLMAQAGVDAPVELRRVESDEAAERERFLGSPTLRVNGKDVDPAAGGRTDFGLKCRLYPSADGLRGTVPDEFVVAALTRARGGAMRRSADAGDVDGLDAFARALQSTFPARDDAPVALALLRLLSDGRPVGAAALARAADRTEAEVVGRLSSWPNVERDRTGHIVAFSGLTLRPTAHEFRFGHPTAPHVVRMGHVVPARPVGRDRGGPLHLPGHELGRRARRCPGRGTERPP